jgi:tetratricopeptide (TPR) repeat protein
MSVLLNCMATNLINFIGSTFCANYTQPLRSMNWFTFGGRRKKLEISQEDRKWVEDSFSILLGMYGYPHRKYSQRAIDKESFVRAFSGENVTLGNLFEDMKEMFGFFTDAVSYELVADGSDIEKMPFEWVGSVQNHGTVITETEAKVLISKGLAGDPDRLVDYLILEFVKIVLRWNKVEYDVSQQGTSFLYLVAVFFGFGAILSKRLVDIGHTSNGSWDTTWSQASELPEHILGFALALFSKLIDEDNPAWKKGLAADVNKFFEEGIILLNEEPTSLFNENELAANDLLLSAQIHYESNDFDRALAAFEETLTLTTDFWMKLDAMCSVGYCQIRKCQFEESISSYNKALEILPDYDLAEDNLSYSLIMLGRLDEGKKYLDKLFEHGTKVDGYTYRNLALYHEKRGETEFAENNYNLALDYDTNAVDLLELHYSDFMITQGRQEEAVEMLKRGVARNEPEAMKHMEELTQTRNKG